MGRPAYRAPDRDGSFTQLADITGKRRHFRVGSRSPRRRRRIAQWKSPQHRASRCAIPAPPSGEGQSLWTLHPPANSATLASITGGVKSDTGNVFGDSPARRHRVGCGVGRDRRRHPFDRATLGWQHHGRRHAANGVELEQLDQVRRRRRLSRCACAALHGRRHGAVVRLELRRVRQRRHRRTGYPRHPAARLGAGIAAELRAMGPNRERQPSVLSGERAIDLRHRAVDGLAVQ
jgi:hypothetical protein